MNGPRERDVPGNTGLAEVPLSKHTLGALVIAWKAGREALTLLVIGTIAILAAFSLAMTDRGGYAILFLVAGFALISLVAVKFYNEAVLPAKQARKQLEQNAELIDAVQEALLQLADIISKINEFALINANGIVAGIDQAKSAIAAVPLIGPKLLEAAYFKKPD